MSLPKRYCARFTHVIWVSIIVLVFGCSRPSVDLRPFVPGDIDLGSASTELRTQISGAREAALTGNQSLESLKTLAQLYHANGFLNEAIQSYEGLVLFESDEPRWKHKLATILSGYGYSEDAIMLWREALNEAPEYIPIYIRIGDALLKSGEANDAKIIFQECLQQDANNPYALVGLARIAIQNGSWVEARELLENASKHSEGRVGRDLLVTAYENSGEPIKAYAIRGEAKASGSFVDIPDPWINEMYTYCYSANDLVSLMGYEAFRGNFSDALIWGKRAINLQPDHAIAHLQLASIYVQDTNAELAIKHYKRAIEIDETLSDAWLQLSQLYASLNQIAQSDLIFYQGLEKCPNSPAYRIQYAERLMKEQNYREAITQLNRSIELLPNEAPAYIVLSKAHFALNEMDAGLQALQTALEVENGNPVAMTTITLYSILSENREQADYWIERVKLHPRIESAIFNELVNKYITTFRDTPDV